MGRVRIHVTEEQADMDKVCESIENSLSGAQPKDRTWLLVDYYKVSFPLIKLIRLNYRFDREDLMTRPEYTEESDDLSLQEFLNLETNDVQFFREIRDLSWEDLWLKTEETKGFRRTPFAFPNRVTWKAHESLDAFPFTQAFVFDLVAETPDDSDLAEEMKTRFLWWQPRRMKSDGTSALDVEPGQIREVDWLHLAGIWVYLAQRDRAYYQRTRNKQVYPGGILQEEDLSYTEAVMEDEGAIPMCRMCYKCATEHLLFDGTQRLWWCDECYWEFIVPQESDNALLN